MGETSVQELTVILNSVWESEVVSSDWKRGTIVKISKKGNLSGCSNWRGITDLSVPGKVLSIPNRRACPPIGVQPHQCELD